MVLLEDLDPCVSMWLNPSRTHGYKWGLLKIRKGNIKGTWWGAAGVYTESMLFFFRCFLKPTLTHGKGRLRRFPSNNE
jgi:hypothetical protein